MRASVSNGTSAKNGGSRVWIGLGVVAGAAVAYLATAQRASQLRTVLAARFVGDASEQLPEQITLPPAPVGASAYNPED